MRSDNNTQSTAIQTRQDRGRCRVGKVSIIAANTALQGLGVAWIVREQRLVMVALQDQGIQARVGTTDVGRSVADIGQDAQSGATIINHVLDRLPRIVRHRDRQHPESGQIESGVGLNLVKVQLRGHFASRQPGTVRHVDRYAVSDCEFVDPAQMITVLMGDHNRIERLGIQAGRAEPILRFTQPEPAVNQEMGRSGPVGAANQEAIAFAATAQARKLQKWLRNGRTLRAGGGLALSETIPD